MIITMIVQLFTVRVVLEALGDVDYGINNVVAGVVTMFAFLSATMATASQRYFSYEIGKGDLVQLKKLFSLTLITYCIIAVIVFVLAETIGLWFLNNKMVIPENRMFAANWCYQFAILSFMMTMFQVPYDAMVIAREKMNVFAYVSILEVFLKLGIVYLLKISSYDRLITYGFLGLLVVTIVTTTYKYYCLRKFPESHFKWYWNKNKFKEICSYSGWNLFGSVSGVFYNQGINVLLNVFFGPVVNTGRAIAFQVNGAINQFVLNFMTATRPQITKLYATEEYDKMFKLVFRSTKFSYFLLFFFAMPVFWEVEPLFRLWLGSVPNYVVIFTRLAIVISLIDSLSYSIMTAVQATGKIKQYQLVVGLCFMLNLPISFLFLKLGFPPETTLFIGVIVAMICFVLRVVMLRKLIVFDVRDLISHVVVPVVILTVLTNFLGYFIFGFDGDSMVYTAVKLFSFLTVTIVTIYLVGLSLEERVLIKSLLLKKIAKIS